MTQVPSTEGHTATPSPTHMCAIAHARTVSLPSHARLSVQGDFGAAAAWVQLTMEAVSPFFLNLEARTFGVEDGRCRRRSKVGKYNAPAVSNIAVSLLFS